VIILDDFQPTKDNFIAQFSAAVVSAYDTIKEEMGTTTLAPELLYVHLEFQGDVVDNMVDVYQDFFGEGAKVSDEGFIMLGIDPQGIPNIAFVKMILDMFRLPYIFEGRLYNIAQPRFFD